MIVIDKDVMVPMTDGVRLATDVFRLQEAPPSPVLLVRTPDGKDPRSLEVSSSGLPQVRPQQQRRRRHHYRNCRPVPAPGQPCPA
jgi:predicted acyl esterase